jgi:hypothetical protein
MDFFNLAVSHVLSLRFDLPRICPVLAKEVNFKLTGRIPEVAPGNDVVTFEYGPSFVTTDGHGHALGYVGPHKVTEAGAAQIMEYEPMEADPLAGGLPDFIEASDTPSVTRKYEFSS